MTSAALARRENLVVMDTYLEALVRKNLSLVPLADGCKITFNGQPCELGRNFLWRNALHIPQRQVFADPVSGNTVLLGISTNEFQNFQGFDYVKIPGDGALTPDCPHPFYATTMIRLHQKNGQIDEIEEVFEDRRYAFLRVPYSDIRLPELIFDVPVPEEERLTREELKAVVDIYWDCISKARPAEDLPLHPEARRIENGMCCTHNNGTFRGEFRGRGFTWDTPANRRFFPVIDMVRGVVLSTQGFVEVEGTDPGNKNPYIIDVFKIEDGLIRQITAFFRKDMAKLGW